MAVGYSLSAMCYVLCAMCYVLCAMCHALSAPHGHPPLPSTIATMRGAAIIVGLIALAGESTGAVPGIPTPPTPGPLPDGWFEHANDNLADGVLNNDDFRTGAFAGGATWRR